MKRFKQQHADYSTGKMETGDHLKNGANPKSLTSRGNFLYKQNLLSLFVLIIFSLGAIGGYAQIIETPSRYDIRTVSIKNVCEEALYAQLASKAAAEINDDRSLSYQLSICASDRGGSLVYRGITYENPLPQPYANTYWNRRAALDCNKPKQAGNNPGKTSTNSGNNDYSNSYGSEDNNRAEAQDNFDKRHEEILKDNDITMETTKIAINNLRRSQTEIEDNMEDFRDDKMDLANKYQKKSDNENKTDICATCNSNEEITSNNYNESDSNFKKLKKQLK
jgi:hypothetical protein